MSSTPILFVLLKIFDEREHAEAFMAGKLHMKTPRHFREYRDASGQLRGDPYEGLAGLISANGIHEIQINGKAIKGSQLTGPLRIFPSHLQDVNILCLYSINTSGLGSALTAENAIQTRETFRLHKECHGLGNYVVVIHPQPFIERLKAAATKQKVGLQLGLVEYYEEDKLDGFFKEEEVLFRKRAGYSFLREYRAVIGGAVPPGEVLTFDIGDLSDITSLTTPADLDASVEFKLEDGRTLDQFIEETTGART